MRQERVLGRVVGRVMRGVVWGEGEEGEWGVERGGWVDGSGVVVEASDERNALSLGDVVVEEGGGSSDGIWGGGGGFDDGSLVEVHNQPIFRGAMVCRWL